MANDYLTSIEDKKEEKLLPKFRSFYTISGLPYEVMEHDVTSVVSELIHNGAARVVIERQIIDENMPEAPQESVPELAEFLPPVEAELASAD
jgi:hypothetical protein